ncbi:hypothetical protein Tco_0644751 [Tanacetum coccineum]
MWRQLWVVDQSRLSGLVVINSVLTGLIVAGPTDGATDYAIMGTTRLRWGSKSLRKTQTVKGVGLHVAESYTGNHREDNFMPLETIQRFLGAIGSKSLLASKGRPSSQRGGYVITINPLPNAPTYPNHGPKGIFPDSTCCVTPFVRWIEDYPLQDELKMPSYLGSYKGKGDPDNYLHLFEGAIRMQKWAMPVACHMFTYTLKDSTRIW